MMQGSLLPDKTRATAGWFGYLSLKQVSVWKFLENKINLISSKFGFVGAVFCSQITAIKFFWSIIFDDALSVLSFTLWRVDRYRVRVLRY